MREQCNIQHRHAGCRCILAKGHDGHCWSAAERHSYGVFVRCVWHSKDGEFKSHHNYERTRPSAVTEKEPTDG